MLSRVQKVINDAAVYCGEISRGNFERRTVIIPDAGDLAELHYAINDMVDRIDWPEGFCRRDIGWRAVARENA